MEEVDKSAPSLRIAQRYAVVRVSVFSALNEPTTPRRWSAERLLSKCRFYPVELDITLPRLLQLLTDSQGKSTTATTRGAGPVQPSNQVSVWICTRVLTHVDRQVRDNIIQEVRRTTLSGLITLLLIPYPTVSNSPSQPPSHSIKRPSHTIPHQSRPALAR